MMHVSLDVNKAGKTMIKNKKDRGEERKTSSVYRKQQHLAV